MPRISHAELDDLRLKGAEIEFVDLNFAEARLVEVPGGGMVQDDDFAVAESFRREIDAARWGGSFRL